MLKIIKVGIIMLLDNVTMRDVFHIFLKMRTLVLLQLFQDGKTREINLLSDHLKIIIPQQWWSVLVRIVHLPFATRIHNSRGYPTSVWVKVVAHWRFQPSSMIIGIIRIKLSELYFALAYIFTCSDWSKMSCLLNYLGFKMAHGIPLALDNWKSSLAIQGENFVFVK